MENCRNGKHNLIGITSNRYGVGEIEVVRWCEYCGAIVVDKEFDGRTIPGYYMKMKFPVLCTSFLQISN